MAGVSWYGCPFRDDASLSDNKCSDSQGGQFPLIAPTKYVNIARDYTGAVLNEFMFVLL